MAEGLWTVIVDVNVGTFSDSFTITHTQQTTTLPPLVITVYSQNSEFRSFFLPPWHKFERIELALDCYLADYLY